MIPNMVSGIRRIRVIQEALEKLVVLHDAGEDDVWRISWHFGKQLRVYPPAVNAE